MQKLVIDGTVKHVQKSRAHSVFSKRELEGYVLIDHRDSPGLTKSEAQAAGRSHLDIGAGKKFEAATSTCSHCERIVILNPSRTRERGYCFNCDHFICDPCAVVFKATGTCRPWKKVIEDFANKQAKNIILP